MTDLFLLLQLPNSGDDLQAIKRGVMERADLVVVNKADLDPVAAQRAAFQLGAGMGHRGAAHVVSALSGDGIDALWAHIVATLKARETSGETARRRREQATAWMRESLRTGLMSAFHADPAVREQLPALLGRVESGELPPASAARALLETFLESPRR
jgi:LAO/AO transport system kinase